MSPWLLNVYVDNGWCGARGECKGAWETAGTSAGEWWQI